MELRVAIRGGGDLGSGIARRLFVCGMYVVVLERAEPLVLRRTVSFAEAVFAGSCEVEGVRGLLVEEIPTERPDFIPVLVDEEGEALSAFRPDVLVDARMLKGGYPALNGSRPYPVIGIGPGVEVGRDCQAVVETDRGHDLGRVILSGEAKYDTGIPSPVEGFTSERLLRAPAAGRFESELEIGAEVEAGQVVAIVGGEPVVAGISGVLRGLIRPGVTVERGWKVGDVDPRGIKEHCYSISDKANAVAGGVLEALLYLHSKREET